MLSAADLRATPALLKLDLYCKGMRIDDSCLIAEDSGRRILRTRAGLGSGLELVLPGGLWTNVPVTESFAKGFAYVPHREQGRYLLRRDDCSGRSRTRVAVANPAAGWRIPSRARAPGLNRSCRFDALGIALNWLRTLA